MTEGELDGTCNKNREDKKEIKKCRYENLEEGTSGKTEA
jgi:hypothetical protein